MPYSLPHQNIYRNRHILHFLKEGTIEIVAYFPSATPWNVLGPRIDWRYCSTLCHVGILLLMIEK
jgi:hypothetical protein